MNNIPIIGRKSQLHSLNDSLRVMWIAKETMTPTRSKASNFIHHRFSITTLRKWQHFSLNVTKLTLFIDREYNVEHNAEYHE